MDKVGWHTVKLLCKATNIMKCREERKVFILSCVNSKSIIQSKPKMVCSQWWMLTYAKKINKIKHKLSLWLQRFYSSCLEPTQWWTQNNHSNMWHPFKIKPRSTSSGNQDCCTFNILLWPKGVARWQCDACEKEKYILILQNQWRANVKKYELNFQC